MSIATRLYRLLRQEWLFAVLLAALPILLTLAPAPLATVVGRLPQLVHWETLGALTGLMILSRGLEDSGYLAGAGRWLLARVRGERPLAIVLVLFAAGLAAVVTNDIALFIVVPLTLGLRSAARLPIGRLVVCEALAVNAGSALSPVGNPQNLYLWRTAEVSFLEFGLAMAPLAGALMIALLATIPLAFAGGRIEVRERLPNLPLRRGLLWLSLALYPIFLVCAELGWSVLTAILLAGLYRIAARDVLRGVDWALLGVFALMFVDLGLLAELPVIAARADHVDTIPGGVLTAGILLSQLLSNVPAAIFLESFTDDWIALAWGVSVGGFGLAIGSMANLIALRLAREPGLWRVFHCWSIPALALGWSIAWLLQQTVAPR